MLITHTKTEAGYDLKLFDVVVAKAVKDAHGFHLTQADLKPVELTYSTMKALKEAVWDEMPDFRRVKPASRGRMITMGRTFELIGASGSERRAWIKTLFELFPKTQDHMRGDRIMRMAMFNRIEGGVDVEFAKRWLRQHPDEHFTLERVRAREMQVYGPSEDEIEAQMIEEMGQKARWEEAYEQGYNLAA